MANDIDKTSPHYKGEFGSIYEVNQKFPNGGVAGDYVEIDGWAHYWNADRETWCVNAQRDSYWDELITGIIEKFKLFKGATYMGVAGLDTVPAKAIGAKMYYFATVAGTYKNFGGLVVPQGINVLYSENGSSWVCSTLLEVAQELGVSTRNVVSQKVVNEALAKKADKETVDVELGKKANTADVNTKFTEEKKRLDAELDKKFDKESIAKETGDSEELVMSQKAVSTILREITKRDTIETEEDIIFTNNSEDEIILKIANNGVDAKNLKSNGIDILEELDKKATEDLLNNKTDGINHEQSQSTERKVIFGRSEDAPSLVIGEDSVMVKSITDLQGNPIGGRLPLLGKELFTIGDSLSTSGLWQEIVSKKTGCTFDSAKNIKSNSELSQGGTTTNESSLHSGILRAFNLKANNYSPDIILLQNVNDQTCFDDSGNNKYESGTAHGKKAFVPTQIIDGGSYSQWENGAASYLSTISTNDRKFGSIIKFANVQNGKKVSVSKLPTSSGNVRITINDVIADITVSTSDTKASIIHKIFEYNYGNDIRKNENLNDSNPYVEFYTSSESLTLVYTDSDSTSMTIVSEDKQTNSIVLKYFFSESLQDWQNVDSWKNGLTPYQAWKGMIEFCISNFPTAKIALLMFPRLKFDRNLYTNKDGTFNQDLYNEKDVKDGDSEAIKKEKIDRIKCRARISLQEDVAQFYNLPIIDLNKDCGINVGNYLSFYPNNNVHPKDIGYEFYGSIIANKIINI